MARNPKQDANLKPIQKGELSKEEAKSRGHNGGVKSGESRRAKRDARSAIRYLLNLEAKGSLQENLQKLGLPENEQTNQAALQARLFTTAMSGNIEAYLTLMKMAGYDPEEVRKERESVAADRRRETELDMKAQALSNNANGVNTSLNMNDEDGYNDVVIYMPKQQTEEECSVDDDDEAGEADEDAGIEE
ncbi:MAG: hypothetical protein LUD12_10340 [Lachnospiraceae bacterium]|nr:hypothetical protein [Lachnospiraceae bacterium]